MPKTLYKNFFLDRINFLLTNHYLYQDVPEQLRGAHYLILLSKFQNDEGLFDAGLDLLFESVKLTYGQTEISNTRSPVNLVLLAIYLIRLSNAEKFSIEIEEALEAIERFAEKTTTNYQDFNVLYLTLNATNLGAKPKFLIANLRKLVSSINSETWTVKEIFLITLTIYHNNKFHIKEIDEQMQEKTIDIYRSSSCFEDKAILLFCLWLLDPSQKSCKRNFNYVTEAAKLQLLTKNSNANNVYLVKYILFKAKGVRCVDQFVDKPTADQFQGFSVEIYYLLKTYYYRYNTNMLISTVFITEIYDQFYK